MTILNDLKRIYSGNNSIFNHVTLFSVIGIAVISLLCSLSSALSWLMLNSFPEISPFSPAKSYFILIIGIILGICVEGYVFNFAHKIFQNEYSLPELSLSSFVVFFKALPLIIVWTFYYFILFVSGLFLPVGSIIFNIYFAILICLIPFIWTIFIQYLKDFKYAPYLFSPAHLFKVLNNTFGKTIILLLKLFSLSIIPAVFIYFLLKYSNSITDPSVKLGVKIFACCILGYFIIIFKTIFNIELVKIIEEKLSKQVTD